MEDNISKIKDRLNIVDVISGYIKVQKSGVNYKARCPFHNEKSASFFISPDRQIWHCFGCGLGGDIFGFIKQIDGVEFYEALKILADKAGIELTHNPSSPGQSAKNRDEKYNLYIISELAMKFFEKQLWNSDTGKKALAYLRQRGLTDETIKKFHLGYAPDANNALLSFLVTSEYDNKELVSAGVTGRTEDGRLYDRFRARVMFPIIDMNGRPVGFSGRIFESGLASKPIEPPAKYINTPQTVIYDKSRILYGLNEAKIDIRKKDKCLVVEGNMDVIMSHQAGATNVVASSGTALTDGHLKIIKRYTNNLNICFDADNAGQMATERGIDLALEHGMNVNILTINEKDVKDAADYVKKYGQAWAEYSETSSQPFMDFYIKKLAQVYDVTTAMGKKTISQKLLPLVKMIPSKIEQSHWVQEIALLLKTKEELLMNELAEIQTSAPRDFGTNDVSYPVAESIPKLDSLEEILVSLILKKPDMLKIDELPYDLLSEKAGLIVDAIHKSGGEGFDEMIKMMETQSVLNTEFAYLKSQELWKDFQDNDLHEEFQKVLTTIKKRKISAQLADLEFSIKEAEKKKDKDIVLALSSKFNEIILELNHLNNNVKEKS